MDPHLDLLTGFVTRRFVHKYDKLETSSAAAADVEDDKEYDEELKKYGGRFDWKIAIGQVTFRFPIELRLLNLIALLYGFLPWAVPITFGVSWLVTRHFILLYGLVTSLVTSLINEVLLKPFFNDPRPRQSANRHPDGTMKPGMPSGHVLNATTIMVWAMLEVLLRGPGVHESLTWSWFVFIIALMGPVPWARWYNYDHTLKQCLVAGVLGLFVGLFAYWIRITYFQKHWQPWDVNDASHHEHTSQHAHKK